MTDSIAIVVAAIPPTMTGIVTVILAIVNHQKVAKVEQNTNNKLDQILDQRNAAAARADTAEGKLEGVKAEQDRTTKGT